VGDGTCETLRSLVPELTRWSKVKILIETIECYQSINVVQMQLYIYRDWGEYILTGVGG
jgi:hypothetical protein